MDPAPSILIVEDDHELLNILSTAFSRDGFEVAVAENVDAAIEKVESSRFKAILLDIRLASGSGEEVVKHVRGDADGKNYFTPIIVMSGYMEVEVARNIRSKVDDIVLKPFRLAAIVAKVKELL